METQTMQKFLEAGTCSLDTLIGPQVTQLPNRRQDRALRRLKNWELPNQHRHCNLSCDLLLSGHSRGHSHGLYAISKLARDLSKADRLMEPINSEIFSLTYGSLVRQLLADLEDVEAVNKQLDTMGYNIGTRLIDEFLAKSKTTKCLSFRDAVDKMAKVGFKLFLNVQPAVSNWDAKSTQCSLIFDDNPLADFVELPESCAGLCFSNLLCGVIRGALEQVKINVTCRFLRDQLRGDGVTELQLQLISTSPETYPYQDDD